MTLTVAINCKAQPDLTKRENPMFLLGLAIAAVIAAFVASDASKRGMSAGGWFFGVFLLLIVFLPAYFIVRKPLLPQYQPQLSPQATPSLCPHCGKYYAGKATFCPFCGKPQVGGLMNEAEKGAAKKDDQYKAAGSELSIEKSKVGVIVLVLAGVLVLSGVSFVVWDAKPAFQKENATTQRALEMCFMDGEISINRYLIKSATGNADSDDRYEATKEARELRNMYKDIVCAIRYKDVSAVKCQRACGYGFEHPFMKREEINMKLEEAWSDADLHLSDGKIMK